MDSKVVYYDLNFLKIGHALTTNPHKKQFKHVLMCNHPIIISVELVSLVESHVVEFYIRFIKKKILVQEVRQKAIKYPKICLSESKQCN